MAKKSTVQPVVKQTAKQKREAAAEVRLRNPLTGQAPNTFTQSTTQQLLPPVAVHPFVAPRETTNSTDAHPIDETEIAARKVRNEAAIPEHAAEGKRLRGMYNAATKSPILPVAERRKIQGSFTKSPEGVVTLHEGEKPGSGPSENAIDAQFGWRKPTGMSSRNYAWLMGAHHMFPNESAERKGPAINEPHATDPSITLPRRAEDLSGPEYQKGLDVLSHFGHNPKDPMKSLVDTQSRHIDRIIAEHVQAGVNESGSQKFYGGPITTEIPDQPEMEAAHYEGVNASYNRFRKSVTKLAVHPDFINKTPKMSHPERMSAANSVMAQSTSDVSPNSTWKEATGTWPNMDQADEVVRSTFAGQEPKFISGRVQNNEKAQGRMNESMQNNDYAMARFGIAHDPDTGRPKYASPKASPFRGAFIDRAAPDAMKISDVHEGRNIQPGLPVAKSFAYTGGGKTTNTNIYPDDPPSKSQGMTRVQKVNKETGKLSDVKGLSRPEQMLNAGNGLVHSLNDYATRKALADHGLSRSVSHADNIHPAQGAVWGSQQVIRPDVTTSHADQYPVVRDYGDEGVNVSNGQDTLGSLQRGETHTNIGQQFRLNPNTTGRSKSQKTAHLVNPTKSKAYPVMPGD